MVVGSIAVGVWVARLVLAVLIVQALIEQRYRVAGVAVVLALVGWVMLDRFNPYLVTPFLAIVDIALVFIVLGHDVRLN
jgi:hypothetical protein